MINGSQLRDAYISGANHILAHRQEVDALNVFPVPDGDTGTNMSMTIGAAVAELKLMENPTAAAVAKTAASALLRGARGNSGVILSLLFRGFSKGLAGKKEADGADFAQALTMGVEAFFFNVTATTEIYTVNRIIGHGHNFALITVEKEAYTWGSNADSQLGASDWYLDGEDEITQMKDFAARPVRVMDETGKGALSNVIDVSIGGGQHQGVQMVATTMDVVQSILCGKVNKDLVAQLNRLGGGVIPDLHPQQPSRTQQRSPAPDDGPVKNQAVFAAIQGKGGFPANLWLQA